MATIVLVVHMMIAAALIGVVLIQRSEGGALGGLGGGNFGGIMSGRGTANLLTRTTAILAACFVVTSIGLALLAGHGRSRSLLDTALPPGPTPPAATAPSTTAPAPSAPTPSTDPTEAPSPNATIPIPATPSAPTRAPLAQ